MHCGDAGLPGDGAFNQSGCAPGLVPSRRTAGWVLPFYAQTGSFSYALAASPRETLRPEESALGQLLCLMRLAAAPLAELSAELARAVPRLEALTVDDVAEWRDLLYYLQLFIAYYRSPEEGRTLSTTLVAAHQDRRRREEMEAMGKTYFQALIEEGEGRGEARGEVRGRRLMLLNQMEAKFGPLPETVVQTMERQSVAQLEALAVRLIEAQSLEELGLG
jgi:hypothetical protein